MTDISVVIVTFNSDKFIAQCLDCFAGLDKSKLEVIVVDNASTDKTIDLISVYPDTVLIKNKDNLGPAKARNQGIEAATGEWILTLDCDTVPDKYFFDNFDKIKESLTQEIGIIQAKILRSDKKTIYSTGVFLSWARRFYDIGKGKIDNGQFEEQKFIFAACSAAAFYRRSMLDKIKEKGGFFDPNFFFLVEDIDLAWRAKKCGYRALYYPKSVCYHRGNGSGTSKRFRQYLSLRNRYLLLQKNDLMGSFKKAALILLYDLPRIAYLVITNSYVFKGLNELDIFYRKVPSTQRYRQVYPASLIPGLPTRLPRSQVKRR